MTIVNLTKDITTNVMYSVSGVFYSRCSKDIVYLKEIVKKNCMPRTRDIFLILWKWEESLMSATCF
jgi:hypothetical protein